MVRRFSRLGAFYQSAPIQIFLLHFRKNHLIFFSWLLFLLIFTGKVGGVLGIPHLFLHPEYLHEINFLSFSLLGASIGLFSWVFQITTYILYAARFPFFGWMRRPFLAFSINNALFPLFFHIFFICAIVGFQQKQTPLFIHALEHVGGYFAGVLCVIFLFGSYFYWADRRPVGGLTERIDRGLKRTLVAKVRAITRFREAEKQKSKKRYFLSDRFTVKNTQQYPRSYDKKKFLRVFDRNHFNILWVGLLPFLCLLLLGRFADITYFYFPAAVNFVLLFTIFFMLMGSAYYWLGEWYVSLFLVIFFLFALLGERTNLFHTHRAFGLDYTRAQPYYADFVGERIAEHVEDDKNQTREMLDHWRSKFAPDQKPSLVLMCVSGGGLCASLFTLRALQEMDARLQKSIMHHTALITGASGGMLGAAYYRALFHRSLQGLPVDLGEEKWCENIAKDKLNPILLSLLVDDIFSFFRGTFQHEGSVYAKDRGYAWEQKVNEDTEGLLDKTIGYYSALEHKAVVPMMIFSPTIVNSGAKLYIASRGVSYMPHLQRTYSRTQPHAGIDFYTFFAENKSASLRFLTALRMNSTFPYIMPYVELPTQPSIRVMDAGLHDNFGIQDAVKFLDAFEPWLLQNVSSVFFLILRSNPRGDTLDGRILGGGLSWLTEPITLLYKNIPNMQTMSNYRQLYMWRDKAEVPVRFFYLSYEDPNDNSEREDISLSWHLTPREKEKVIKSLQTPDNKAALDRLTEALNSTNAPRAATEQGEQE